MATIEIQGLDGKRVDTLRFRSLPPEGYELPSGHTITMRELLPTPYPIQPTMIRRGGAVANILPYPDKENRFPTSLAVEYLIESDNIPDFLRMQKEVIKKIDGEVIVIPGDTGIYQNWWSKLFKKQH